MGIKRTFKVSENKDAKAREVTIELPAYEALTEVQRKILVERAWKDVIINVLQGPLRGEMKNYPTAEALNKRAQERLDAFLSGSTISTAKVRQDAAILLDGFDLTVPAMVKLARKQIDTLVASGVEVYNIPEVVAKAKV